MDSSPVAAIRSLIGQIRVGITAAIGRFPLVFLSGLTGTVCACALVFSKGALEDVYLRLLTTAALGMPLFFSLRMIRERHAGSGPLLELAGMLVLALWFWSLPSSVEDAPRYVWIRWGLLLDGLHFFASISAYLGKHESLGFWQFNRHLFLRFNLALLYSVVLTAGLELALASADQLFELRLKSEYYACLFLVMAGCFHPAFFLAGVPRDLTALNADERYPRGLKLFTQSTLAPLAAVFTVILYLYGAKILLLQKWPNGWVALPVLILAGVGVFAAVMLHPLKGRVAERWAAWFSRWFPRALSPLALLLLFAVLKRVDAYGITEPRYLGLVAGGWILLWAVVFSFTRNPGIRWIPASLALICLIAALGPLSAGALSLKSQTQRLHQLLAREGLWSDGRIVVPDRERQIPAAQFDDLYETMEYVFRTHGKTALRTVFGGLMDQIARPEHPGYVVSELTEALRIKAAPKLKHGFFRVDALPGSIPVEQCRKLWVFRELTDLRSWKPSAQPMDGIFIGLHQGKLQFSEKAEEAPQPMKLVGDPLASPAPGSDFSGDMPVQALTSEWEWQGKRYRIVFTKLEYRIEPDGMKRITSCSLVALQY